MLLCLLCLLCLLGCLACAAPGAEEPPYPDPQPTSPPAPVAYALFEVRSDVVTRIRAGEPVVIETVVAARAPVERASIVLAMPEVAAARATGWGEGYRMFDVGVRAPAIDSVVASITPGQPLTRRTTLRFEAPGYYHVIATASALDERLFEENGVPLVDPQHYSYYVWVDDETGYVTSDFDPTRLPLTSDGSSGPLRIPPDHPLGPLLDSARVAPRTHAVVEGAVLHADGRPAADARVVARAYIEGCPGRGVAEETTRTDSAGRYRVLLRGWFARPFDACVALHADADGAHAAARTEVRMNSATSGAATARLDLHFAD